LAVEGDKRLAFSDFFAFAHMDRRISAEMLALISPGLPD
jgi:hypothetical protein